MAQKVLSIDIGTYSIKLCLVERYLRDFAILAFHEQIINQSNRLTHEEGVAAALRQIKEKNNLSADIISVNLPAHLLNCRVLELPFTNLKKIEQTIEFELESFIPVALDDLLIDYHILEIGETMSKALIAYIPRVRLVKYLDMLQVAEIDPKYIGVDGIDFSHIAQVAMVPQTANYILLDIGHNKTNLCVMEGAELQYVRSINVAGLHFTRAIQKAFKLNYEKAEGLKLDRGRLTADEQGMDQVSRLCQTVAEELIVAIRQTYLGYKKLYPTKEWRAAYITGGGAKLPGLVEMLATHLRMNVHHLDYLDFIAHELDNAEITKAIMAPVVGQSLRVLFASRAIDVNLRAGEFAYRRDFKALSTEIKQLGVWFSVVLLLGMTHFALSYHWLSTKVEKSEKSFVQAAKKVLPDVGEKKNTTAKKYNTILDTRIQELKPELDALEAGVSRVSSLAILVDISKRLPEKKDFTMEVDDFTLKQGLFKLEGRTNSAGDVDKIKAVLDNSPYLQNVNDGAAKKGQRNEYKFDFTADVVLGADV